MGRNDSPLGCWCPALAYEYFYMEEIGEHASVHWKQGKYQLWANWFMDPNSERGSQMLRATPPPTIVLSVLITRPWSTHQKRLLHALTHWGRVMHICVNKLTISGSVNGLAPGWHPAIIWTNTGILLIWTLGANFSENLREIHIFSFKKMHLKMSARWRQFCLGLNMLNIDRVVQKFCWILAAVSRATQAH